MRQIGIAIALYTGDFDGGYPNTGDPYLWVGRRFRWPIMPYLALAMNRRGGTFDAEAASRLLLCPADFQSAATFDATSYFFSAAFYLTPTQVDAARIRNLIFQVRDPGPLAIPVTQTESAVAQPSHKIMVGEWFNSHRFTTPRPVGLWGTLQPGLRPGPDRWDGARNALFADLHVRFVHARAQTPSAQDAPDPNLTPGGLGGSDLR